MIKKAFPRLSTCRSLLIAVVSLSSATLIAQAPPKAYAPAKTAWGDPDLQGIFTNATVTPLERPSELAGKNFLTEKEVAEWEALAAKGRVDEPPREGETGTYNQFWDDHGTKAVSTRRSSLIIDPPDGQIPLLTEAAQKLIAERAEIRRGHGFDGPEFRPINERCLWRASTGPPIFPVAYNNNYRITQTPGYAMILSEMIHDARIILLMVARICRKKSANTWAIRAVIGRATRLSSKRR